jgi:hypothetical protein
MAKQAPHTRFLTLPFVEVRPSAQPCSTHAAAIEDMGKGPLDHFSASAHDLAPDIRSQPHAIGVDRLARRLSSPCQHR